MESIKFRSVKEKKEILKVLDYFTPCLETLKSGIVDKNIYTEKIKKNGKTIVLEVNNELAGFATFYCNNYKDYNAYLSFIAIDKKYEHKGLGRILLDEIKNISKKHDMKYLSLEVRKENLKALAFYKREEFYKVNGETNYSIKMQCLL